jgi:hypothetical protein
LKKQTDNDNLINDAKRSPKADGPGNRTATTKAKLGSKLSFSVRDPIEVQINTSFVELASQLSQVCKH